MPTKQIAKEFEIFMAGAEHARKNFRRAINGFFNFEHEPQKSDYGAYLEWKGSKTKKGDK